MSGGRHVALLRGINVGGKNLIKMDALRARFEAMGFTEVATYIQSGNVVFRSRPTAAARLTATIERGLSEAFGYQARVVVVSAGQLARVIAQAPAGFGSQPARYRYDVAFVKPPAKPAAALPEVPARAGVDTVAAGDHALYLRRLIARAGQSQLSKLAQRPVYQQLTVRNWNTTTRLLEMAAPPV